MLNKLINYLTNSKAHYFCKPDKRFKGELN